MKNILTLSAIICFSHYSNAQNSNSNANTQWKMNGNNASTTDFMGTTNSQSLVFKTNNVDRLQLDMQGKLILISGKEMIINPSGLMRPEKTNPISAYMLKVGGSGHFDGEVNARQLFVQEYITYMKSLKGPSMNVDTIRMDSTRGIFGHTKIFGDVQIKQSLEVIGNAKFKGNLNTFGNTTLGGTLKLESFAGSGGGMLSIDNNGNVFRRSSISCIPGSPQWSIGGDNFTPYSLPDGSLSNEASAGTCNNYDYILKSNAVNRAWFKTDGTIGFGTGITSNSGGAEYKFHNGAIRLSGNNSFGSPMIVFDGGVSTFGDWGIEYSTTQLAKPGLNFWKPYASTNSGNYKFLLADDGTIGIGTDNPTSKLTIDAWAGDGLKIMSENSTTSISVFNKNTGKSPFTIFSNGRTDIKASTKIDKYFVINDVSGTSNETFVVYGDGTTAIGPNRPAAGYMLSVSGKIMAEEVVVQLKSSWPDYVFNKDYKLKPLAEVEKYISKNNHLENIPSAKEIDANGVTLGNVVSKQMEKIEELTLYLIEQQKQIEELKKQVESLKK